MPAKTLLVIDDSEAFRETMELTAEDHGWMILASVDLKAIRAWLNDNIPDVVLFDWNLSGLQRTEYLDLLEERSLTGRTLLVSGTIDEVRLELIDRYKLAGYRLKPLDLDRIEQVFDLPSDKSEADWQGIETLANEIEVAVDVMDSDLRVYWSNQKAQTRPITPAQYLIIRWLLATLDKEHDAARRLDWDGGEKRFLETRMFRAHPSKLLWVERDWRAEGDRPHDHEILNLEDRPTLTEWLEGVSLLLAERYAISRLQVYKIAQLPSDNAFEPDPGPLMMPLFQSGGGFVGPVDVWLKKGFLAGSNEVLRAAIAPGFRPKPEHVEGKGRKLGCEEIYYGNQGTSRVVFPVHDDKMTVAVLALDRRLDHAKDGHLQDFDRRVVETASRMASDYALDDEQWDLMSGLVEDLGQRLAEILRKDEERRRRDWHEAITESLHATFAYDALSPEMTYDGLSQVSGRLIGRWKSHEISGHVQGTTPWKEKYDESPLSCLYIALLTGESCWYPVAGSGKAYQLLRAMGESQTTEPHRTLFGRQAWTPIAIQDFQAWLTYAPSAPYQGLLPEVLDGVKGWAAVPMQVEGRVAALLVAHTPHPNYFTELRLKLLKQAAQRLFPLLAAAQRETRARSALTASLMHEVKNDAHAAAMMLNRFREEFWQENNTILSELAHYLDGLEAMGRNSLDVFQLGRPDRIEAREQQQKSVIFQLSDLRDALIKGWDTLYERTKINSTISTDARIEVEHATAFRRVLRILMHNAFRHGRDWVRLTLTLRTIDGHPDRDRLEITVANLGVRKVALGLSEQAHPAISGVGVSPLARGRLGLVVARQLVTEAGASLSPLEFDREGDDESYVEVTVQLNWPVRALHRRGPINNQESLSP